MTRPDGLAGRFTSRSTWALIAALIALVGALALCLDRFHNGDFYLSLVSGRFIANHGFVDQYPFATVAKGGTWLNQQWLSELAFFRISQVLGTTGLTVLYAVLITAPLAILLWLCRRKGWLMLIAITAFYFPGLLAVIHPRAAGFTVVIFSLLVALLAVVWRARAGPASGRLPGWSAGLGIVVLFALWANLHGGFIAGLLLLGLLTLGFAIDHWRGIPGTLPLSRIAALGLLAVLAAVTVTVSTPLGGGDLVLPAQLPEPGDLARQHRVAVGVRRSARDPLPRTRNRLRGLDVGALSAAPAGHDPARHRRLSGIRRLLDPQHRLHRAGARSAGRLDRAEPQPGPAAAPGCARGFGRRRRGARLGSASRAGEGRSDARLTGCGLRDRTST